MNGAERKGFERVAFGHEATDAALELGIAVPAQLIRMRISVLMRWSGAVRCALHTFRLVSRESG